MDMLTKRRRTNYYIKVWLYLYKVWYQVKLIYDDSGQNSYNPWKDVSIARMQEETFWVASNISISWFG